MNTREKLIALGAPNAVVDDIIAAGVDEIRLDELLDKHGPIQDPTMQVIQIVGIGVVIILGVCYFLTLI